ncbi:MAG: methyltransferase domain-containing protein [Reichenbachiella sp.]|uniref:class I SAM-dependent methyltransferase n=1 Tax=Reichenbachiella sp. TaxID=2184521 RepID=UPI0032676316
MSIVYNKYYETENLFGNPYPELIEYFRNYIDKGKVLDLGCGQGRDSIALARLGFEVIGVDHSQVGIDQMNKIARAENLTLEGRVEDIYTYEEFSLYDFILLDSMFHFEKRDLKKETGLIRKILTHAKTGCLVVVCLQDTGRKVSILNETLDEQLLKRLADMKFEYIFEDSETEHHSRTEYRMIAVRK